MMNDEQLSPLWCHNFVLKINDLSPFLVSTLNMGYFGDSDKDESLIKVKYNIVKGSNLTKKLIDLVESDELCDFNLSLIDKAGTEIEHIKLDVKPKRVKFSNLDYHEEVQKFQALLELEKIKRIIE